MREPPTLTPDVTAVIDQGTGELYSLGWYLYYRPGNKTAVLDGDFTAADLRAIADYMDYMEEDKQ